MKKRLLIVVVTILCLAVSGVVWWYLATRDERAVCSLVDEAVALVRKKPSKLHHAGVLKFTKTEEIFGSSVKIKNFKPAVDRQFSQDELKMLLNMMNRHIEKMDVTTDDLNVIVKGDFAEFSFDAEVQGSVVGKNDEFSAVCHVTGSAEKSNGTWKIISIVSEAIVK